jgi:hypothetical protein
MADQEEKKEKDGRLVAMSAIGSYQKGEYVDSGDFTKLELDTFTEQGILWTETQWIAKYKTEPVEHKDPAPGPEGQFLGKPTAPLTTAQAATVVQDTNPALRREGDQRVETTQSGQTPDERKTAATPPGAVARPATSTPTVKSDGQKK